MSHSCTEFYRCNDAPEVNRSLIAVTQNYSIELSPKLKGRNQTAKIAHQLLPGDSDRFQLTINQYLDDPRVVFVWYYLGVTLLASDEANPITTEPLLLSVPPTRMYPGIWETVSRSPCIQKNRETLRRMAGLKANRSDSVETAIRAILEAY